MEPIYDPQTNPDGHCPYDGCNGRLIMNEDGYTRTWSTSFRDGQIIAIYNGAEDWSEDGDGDVYLACSTCTRRVRLPQGDEDLIVWD